MLPVSGGLLLFCWAISHHVRHRQRIPVALSLHTVWIDSFGFALIAVAAAGLVCSCLDPRSITSKLLSFGPLRDLGKISYGFYLLHMLPAVAFSTVQPHLVRSLRLLLTVGYFFLVYGLARLSYRYYETPFLRLKRHLHYFERAPGKFVTGGSSHANPNAD